MPVLLKILGIKVVGTAISLIIFLTKTGPGFDPITITTNQDSLVIQTTLQKAFTKGLDEIILSGTEVGIFFTCTFMERDQDEYITPVNEVTVYQRLIYDITTDSFYVYRDNLPRIARGDPDTAKHDIVSLVLPVAGLSQCALDREYAVRIKAALNTIEIEAIEADQFDLNAFWNYKYPTKNTTWITGEELRAP